MKNRQLLRNSRVVLVYRGLAYHLNALGTFSAESSFSELSGVRKTLHSKTSRKYSIVNRKNPTTISLDVLFTKTKSEGILLELLGGISDGDGYRFTDEIAVKPETFDILVINDTVVNLFTNCYVESMDISFNNSTPLSATVTINSANSGIEAPQPLLDGIMQGLPANLTAIKLQVGEKILNNLTSSTLSIQQLATWREDKSYFDYGAYSYRDAYLTDRLIGLTITANLDTNNKYTEAFTDNIYLSKSGLEITMPNARVIPRLGVSTIYTNSLDVSLTEDSGDVFINFGE